jgi:trimeric autotransporter adhesin
MKKSFLRVLCISVVFFFAFQTNIAHAATSSVAPTVDEVTITNNVKISDTIYITGVIAGDVVKVYNAATGGKIIGKAIVGSGKTDITIKIAQLGIYSGNVYISVTSLGMSESSRTQIYYDGEPVSEAPLSSNITITNNSGKSDTVYVAGLAPGDVIKIYNAVTGGKLLGSATVGSSTTDVTKSFTQLGAAGGSVYISVTSKGMRESSRVEADFASETQSDAILNANVTITNNSGKSDTIYISGLTPGDIIKVYTAATGNKVLVQGTVASQKSDITITISQIGKNAGYVYITDTNKGLTESSRTPVYYAAENESDEISTDNVTITNNTGSSDTINVTGLAPLDKVTVYSAATEGKVLGTATVGSSSSDVTISIAQLGKTSGAVYISVISSSMLESDRVKITYSAESQTTSIDANNIAVTNNAGKSDTVDVKDLNEGDIVKVYDSYTGQNVLGTATVATGSTEAAVTISQLGSAAGTIYVSVTGTNKLESSRLAINYDAEETTSSVSAGNVAVTNNSGSSDTVYVSGLNAGDLVKVYDSASGSNLLGSATVGSTSTDVTISITQLGTAAGNIYVSATGTSKKESSRTEAAYSAEEQSSAIDASNVVVTNNSDKDDTVQVSGLSANDVVNVYDAAVSGNLLGTATVGKYDSEVTITISQLGAEAGSIYISRTSTNKMVSSRTQVDYSAEAQSSSINANNVTVTNNAGTNDTVNVTGLSEGDAVNIYDSASGGSVIGTATVATGSSEVTISINQLGTTAGSIYISATGTSKKESSRTQVNYSAEEQTSAVDASNVVITNNSGKDDTIQVSGLTAKDVINVYDAAKSGNLLGTGTVGEYDSKVTITVSQLSAEAGSIYITRTSTNKSASPRIQVDYSAEAQSSSINANNVTVTNNAGANDTVNVTGLSGGDVVNVYDSASGGSILGTATVATGSTQATISISQLGTAAGSIYISVTGASKLESSRTQVDYSAEAKSTSLEAGNITVTNNAVGTSDVMKVTGLYTGDVINVYDLAKGGSLLGTATVDSSNSSVTISIAQLGTTAGSIYVSVTSTNKSESDRAKADYLAEPSSNAPSASNIVVTNNAGITDTVKVTGLSSKDIIKVYDSATGGTLLGTETVASSGTEATVSIDQVGTAAGNIYVSITSTSKLESSRTQVAFTAEAKSDMPVATKVTIVNNAGKAGTVKVSGLTGGDILNVYDAAQGGTLIGTATVGTYDTDATASITQLGADAGTVYITVTSTGKLESDRTSVAYAAKTVSAAPNADDVTIVNNSGLADTVKIINLQPNDVVKIYSSEDGVSPIASATVASNGMTAAISITQLGVDSGNIYVTVTSTGKTESSRTTVPYAAEAQSDVLDAEDITIVNNAGSTADTVEADGLTSGDIVTVYDAATGGNTLGTATVASGDSEAIVSISQLGTKAGCVYVSVTRSGKTESNRTEADYLSESTAPVAGNITIVNNAVLDDTVTVSGLTANDIVKVYDAAKNGNLLGSAVVSANSTTATISISQLTATAGSVYISVTNFGKGESNRTKADYIAEQSSTPIFVGNINIVNNADDVNDVITVSNLTPSSVVKVYDASTGGNLIGIATASSNGTSVTIDIDQLGTDAGSVYLTVTVPGKNESSRTKADYIAEP